MNVKLVTSTVGNEELKGKTLDEIIVYIARVSSSREDNEKFSDPIKLINYCWKKKHVSIFETIHLGFEVETSLAISHQLVRHKFYFQQFSRRYNSSLPEFEPIELRMSGSHNRQGSTEILLDNIGMSRRVKDFLTISKDLYEDLIKEGVAAECARMILPVATKTTLYATTNVRNWIFYIEGRESDDAQKEHRLVAKEIKSIFMSLLPITSEALWGETPNNSETNTNVP